ncbi:hypothetical protein [Campylobacter vicugnae]|uniref:hypothetical protein n=1 Tax=Campylobacter vicugnae TaxID=1660076 RepID=UPI00254CFF6B|nr:hypothetical protein [Campylobacter ovis]MDL0095643.1 hypothetical protein [Campylobacter ovis]
MTIFLIICAIIFVLFLLFKLTANKQPANLADALHKHLKNSYSKMGIRCVKKMSDEEFTELFKLISDKFDAAAAERGEEFSADKKLKVMAEVLTAIDLNGKKFGIEHLYYEVNRYKQNGSRDYGNKSFLS